MTLRSWTSPPDPLVVGVRRAEDRLPAWAASPSMPTCNERRVSRRAPVGLAALAFELIDLALHLAELEPDGLHDAELDALLGRDQLAAIVVDRRVEALDPVTGSGGPRGAAPQRLAGVGATVPGLFILSSSQLLSDS